MMHYKPNASQSYTLPSRSKKPSHNQNLSKSMPAPTHWQTDWKKEVLATTRNIKNWAKSGKYERINFKKQCHKLKICSFKMPNIFILPPMEHIQRKAELFLSIRQGADSQ